MTRSDHGAPRIPPTISAHSPELYSYTIDENSTVKTQKTDSMQLSPSSSRLDAALTVELASPDPNGPVGIAATGPVGIAMALHSSMLAEAARMKLHWPGGVLALFLVLSAFLHRL